MWSVLSTPEVTVIAAPAPDAARGHAHAMLIRAVSAACGYDPAAVVLAHHCPRCGAGDHGVPTLIHQHTPVPLAISVSRAPGIVIAGWGRVAGLGVDVESAGAAADVALDEVLLHPGESVPTDEVGRTQAWVRKEAALKAWGIGLSVEPSRVRLAAASATTDADPNPVDLVDLSVPGYQACVALLRRR